MSRYVTLSLKPNIPFFYMVRIWAEKQKYTQMHRVEDDLHPMPTIHECNPEILL